MAPLPMRIVRRAGPADDGVGQDEHQDGNDHHAPGFALDVRHGIERHLPAEEGCFVAANLGSQRVRGFVARRGKQENHVPDESQGEEVRGNVGHEVCFLVCSL